MDTLTVPQDLNIEVSSDMQIFNYTNPQDSLKTKINLSKNTISFLRTGTKEIFGNDETVKIENNKFLMMKSGKCLMTEKMPNSNKIYESVLFFFEDQNIINFLEKHKLYSTTQKENKLFYTFEYDTFIHKFVESLQNLLLLPQAMQKKMLESKFEEIMLYLTHQNGASFLKSMLQNMDNKLNRLVSIVENNKLNRLTLEELAFLCNMSVSTFKREFFSQYHTTPMKWFNEQRLNYIAALLKNKQKRPVDLYEDAGYENFSTFVQVFKKKFGMTPKQYQSQI